MIISFPVHTGEGLLRISLQNSRPLPLVPSSVLSSPLSFVLRLGYSPGDEVPLFQSCWFCNLDCCRISLHRYGVDSAVPGREGSGCHPSFHLLQGTHLRVSPLRGTSHGERYFFSQRQPSTDLFEKRKIFFWQEVLTLLLYQTVTSVINM